MERIGNCRVCGAHAPVLDVTYKQNTGMLIARRVTEYDTTACRSCSLRLFRKTFIHNLFLGWWGMLSFVFTSLFMVENAILAIKTLGLNSAGESSANRLEAEADYARAMLSSKDYATVVDVLRERTGATLPQIEEFLSRLPR